MYFFTGDEHYWHKNIITYCNRPFSSVEEMNERMIYNSNSAVKEGDIVIHAGDFALCSEEEAGKIIKRLNGRHVFLNGDHDRWMGKKRSWDIRYYKMENESIIVCHYCMRTWFKSHYNSWHLYAHSHGTLPSIGKSHDIGVDNNSFLPLSFPKIVELMKSKPNNPNYLGDRH
jgi:calcineurin-like phosphoesterase family protein